MCDFVAGPRHSLKRGSKASVWGLIALVQKLPLETNADRKLDFSYHHNVPAAKISDALKSALHDMGINSHSTPRPDETVEIDISGSALGSEGFREVVTDGFLKSVFEDGSVNEAILPLRHVHLTSRRNDLDTDSVSILFGALTSDTNASNTSGTRTDSNSDPAIMIACKSITIESLDLGWNKLNPDENSASTAFLQALRLLIAHPSCCPSTLRLDSCGLGPAACRAIGKGMINRWTEGTDSDILKSPQPKPLSLHFCMNQAIGDGGAAALAAAIRTIALASDEKTDPNRAVLECLDLSACGIGDTGAEALAHAIESSPNCLIRHLDLSNNCITDQGATALGRALLNPEHAGTRQGPGLLSLNLSNNKNIGDRGVMALAEAWEKRGIGTLSLSSCHIMAEGASYFGAALRKLTSNNTTEEEKKGTSYLDLSGNPLGVLRGKNKKDGRKYSASRLKNKASATAASYMNMLKKGLKGAGVDVSPVFGSTAESDDDEEKTGGELDDDEANESPDISKARCGAKALTNAFLGDSSTIDYKTTQNLMACDLHIHIGLRHCFFDHGAADALAALLLFARNELHVHLTMDLELNPVLEDEMLVALQGDELYEDRLHEMAERHTDAMEVLRDAKRRASEAAKAASTRARYSEEAFEADWDAAPSDFGGDLEDSDGDYEEEDEEFY